MHIPLICKLAMTQNQSTRTDTSDAAYKAAPGGAARLCLARIKDRPSSVDELMSELRLSHSTCSAAVNRLMREGWVYDVGMRTVTRAGREAIVWVARDEPKPIANERPTRAQLQMEVEALRREIAMLKGERNEER